MKPGYSCRFLSNLMDFQIKKIVLWPRAADRAPRVVGFEESRLNVITGVSRTGKSAIIPIIDYCLGADKCTIPTGIIRRSVAWFGVVVATAEGEKLFARKEPGLQRATDEMFVAEAQSVEIPQLIAKNAARDSVKQRLDQLAGLTKLSFSAHEVDAGLGRPSFRDMSAFTFQPQNIVANPNVLFYKADTVDHRQKLRTIFPYVLGAVTADVLGKRHELTQLQRELRRKESELAAVRNVSERWRATMQARVAETRDLGLAPASEILPTSHAEMLDFLRRIATMRRPDPSITSATLQEGVSELNRLEAEEAEVSQELSLLKRRFAEMEQLQASASQFRDAVHLQRDRLQVSNWLGRQTDGGHDCPICGNELTAPANRLADLVSSLQSLEQTATQMETVPPSFDREMARVRNAISAQTEKLRGIRIRQTSLSHQSAEARAAQYSILAASRFLGRLEADLKTFESLGQDSELQSEVGSLRDRVNALAREISDAEIGQRTRRALDAVNLNAGRLMPLLDAERPNDPISLSDQELTIKVQGEDREDFLWEIGSGSNWVSYHVAVTLGLQQYFLRLPSCPVPNFIVYDQPSQVYFPKRLAATPEEAADEPEWRDQDVEAVHKLLSMMAGVVRAAKNRLQIIVLDHASESVWGDIPLINVAQDWRDGRALIPRDWIAGQNGH